MYDHSRGGDDTLIGGDDRGDFSINDLIGDADSMSGNARGGDDRLIGGDSADFRFLRNILVGDADAMHDNARGGNDTLIGGAGRTTNSTATPTPCTTTPAAATTR